MKDQSLTTTIGSAVTLAAVIFPAICLAEQDDCKYERQIDAQIDNAQQLAIDAGAGILEIVGDPAATTITINGKACASSQKLLDQIDLRTRDGQAAELETLLPEPDSWFGGNRYAALHLRLSVPETLALDIEDGSGSISVRNTGAVNLLDGSGSVSLRNIDGDLTLSDGSGSISADTVAGNVDIDEDGSGSIEIANVTGGVRIGSDGSGSISIRQVDGSVDIGRDGSGGIVVTQVAGDFRVGRDGSGGIDFDDVSGKLDLPRDKRRHK